MNESKDHHETSSSAKKELSLLLKGAGLSCSTTSLATEQSDVKTEDIDDDEDFDEEDDSEAEDCDQNASGLTAQQRARHAITGRGVTLAMLMDDAIIEAGENVLSIDYLGQKFTADLLSDGSIRWREEDKVFNSPSAWALHCKKIVNPSKKSGCGWASVRYKGKKLDVFKSSWVRKQNLLKRNSDIAMALVKDEHDTETEDGDTSKRMKVETEEDSSDFEPPTPQHPSVVAARVSVKHYTLGKATQHHDHMTLVECHTFAQLCKMQPFNVKISTDALLLIDFHSHLTSSSVIGYLGGEWDPTTQCVFIKHAFPCKIRLGDQDNAAAMENKVKVDMYSSGLTLVGWYHSHPSSQPDPSLLDLEAQMSYQLQLKGMEYHPCLGIIMSPYNFCSEKMDSKMQAFWVMPPPEQRPLDYGIPMNLEFELSWEKDLKDYIKTEMKALALYYKEEPDLIKFPAIWSNDVSFLNKLKTSLSRYIPAHEPPNEFNNFLSSLLLD